MSIFKEYEVGNLVKYDPGFGKPELAKISRINKERTEYELEILGSKATVKYFSDNENTNVQPIFLSTEVLSGLGFRSNEDGTKWSNGVLELISTATQEVAPVNKFATQMTFPTITLTQEGYEVKNLVEDEMLITIDEDYFNVVLVHELQNIYNTQIRGKHLDLSAIS